MLEERLLAPENPLGMRDAQCKRHFALRSAGCCKTTSIDVREFEWDSGKRLSSPVDHGKLVSYVLASFRSDLSSHPTSSNPARTHARGKVKSFITKKNLMAEPQLEARALPRPHTSTASFR